jgi:hypothetical protein
MGTPAGMPLLHMQSRPRHPFCATSPTPVAVLPLLPPAPPPPLAVSMACHAPRAYKLLPDKKKSSDRHSFPRLVDLTHQPNPASPRLPTLPTIGQTRQQSSHARRDPPWAARTSKGHTSQIKAALGCPDHTHSDNARPTVCLDGIPPPPAFPQHR